MLVLHKSKVKCPRCGSNTTPSTSINGMESEFWVECVQCSTYINTYIPLDYQRLTHLDSAKYQMVAGGYGPGKSTSHIQEIEKHALITPRGASLLGANIRQQLKDTMVKMLESDLPIAFLQDYSKQEGKMWLSNGHEFLYKPFDDEGKLRSLNLTSARITEASEVNYSAFDQLQKRLRNSAGIIYERDEEGNVVFEWDKKLKRPVPKEKCNWIRMTLETNPDAGWVRSQFLMHSNTVYLHGDTHNQQYYIDEPSPSYSTHIVATNANYYLPANFIEQQSIGKPQWYIDRYFYGSFEYSEGLVYPTWSQAVISPFKIPNSWKRIIAMDHGVNDNTHFLFAAIDPKHGIAYVYTELVISDASVSQISDMYKKHLDKFVPPGSLLKTPVMDGRSISKRQNHNTEKTLGDLFADEGCIFDPAQMKLDTRLLRTNDYLIQGKLKIFNTCTGLITELKDYKFNPKVLDKTKQKDPGKPVDKNNHGANTLEFLAMELPSDPELLKFKAYISSFNNGMQPYKGHTNKNSPVKPKGFNPFTKNTEQIQGGDFHDASSIFSDGALYGGSSDTHSKALTNFQGFYEGDNSGWD